MEVNGQLHIPQKKKKRKETPAPTGQEAKLKGKCQRGRPKSRWEHQVRKYVINEIFRCQTNHTKWKHLKARNKVD
jgi:hypothetical protein